MEKCVPLVVHASSGLRVLAQKFRQNVGMAVFAAKVASCLFGELGCHLHVQVALLQIGLCLLNIYRSLVFLALVILRVLSAVTWARKSREVSEGFTRLDCCGRSLAGGLLAFSSTARGGLSSSERACSTGKGSFC